MSIPKDSNFIVGRYRIKINPNYKFKEAMEIIATEESVGIESLAFKDRIRIYPGVTGLSRKKRNRFSAKYKIIEQHNLFSGVVDFYFPVENILQEYGTINILFSTLMGDLFGLEVVKDLFLLDVFWPENYLTYFPGPKFGMKGIKKLLHQDYPLFGVIIKPNLGLTPKEAGQLVYNLATAGVAFIKDDELLSSAKNSSIFNRLDYCMEAIARAKKATGKECLFALNVTSDGANTHKMALKAAQRGANCLMLNLFVVGFDILKEIASDSQIKVPIHTHRCMHDLFTSRINFGVSSSVFSALARMCGADFFHVGTVVGKNKWQLANIKESYQSLTKGWFDFNQTVPISSRASILSVEPTHNFFRTKEMMYMSCGAVYKRGSRYYQESIEGMLETIAWHANGEDKRTKSYYNSRKFIEKLKSKYE